MENSFGLFSKERPTYIFTGSIITSEGYLQHSFMFCKCSHDTLFWISVLVIISCILIGFLGNLLILQQILLSLVFQATSFATDCIPVYCDCLVYPRLEPLPFPSSWQLTFFRSWNTSKYIQHLIEKHKSKMSQGSHETFKREINYVWN